MPSKTPPKDEGLIVPTTCCNVPFPKNKIKCFVFSSNSKIYWQDENEDVTVWNPTFFNLENQFTEYPTKDIK